MRNTGMIENNKGQKLASTIQLFFFYAMVGWIYETVLEVIIYRTGFSNRGFLFGPYLPVYGVGALLFLLILYPAKQDRKYGKMTPFFVFAGSMIIATAVELIASYGLSYFDLRLWNYDHYAFNFQGRIALNPSIRFGLGGLIFLYLLQPCFDKIIGTQSEKTAKIVALIILIILIMDFVIKIV